jgi:hypothetical protein
MLFMNYQDHDQSLKYWLTGCIFEAWIVVRKGHDGSVIVGPDYISQVDQTGRQMQYFEPFVIR